MNSYQEKQVKVFEILEEGFKKDQDFAHIVSPVSDYDSDKRICLTSISDCTTVVKTKINQELINPLKESDPRQHYFATDALHITIQNIKVVADPPSFTEEDIQKVQEVFREVVPKHPPITFYLKGLFELPASLAIRAFTDSSYADLVWDLRQGLEKAGVPDDKHYAPSKEVIANLTVCRFTTTPNPRFLQVVRNLKEIDLGEFTIQTIKLITTNSVLTQAKTKIIEKYKLGQSL